MTEVLMPRSLSGGEKMSTGATRPGSTMPDILIPRSLSGGYKTNIPRMLVPRSLSGGNKTSTRENQTENTIPGILLPRSGGKKTPAKETQPDNKADGKVTGILTPNSLNGGNNIVYPEDNSSDFDTDLDIPPPPKVDETTVDKSRSTYKAACSNLGNLPPQQRILDTLGKPVMALSSRSMGPTAIQPLCLALKENNKVETLNLDAVDLQDEGCRHVSEMLLENDLICRLNLSKNGLGPIGAKYLSVALSKSRYLMQVNLSDNYFEYESAVSLSRALLKSNTITTVDLSRNRFCVRSGKILGSAIAEDNTIQKLNLSWNEIRGKGAVAIFKGIKVNACLKQIDLSWNGLGYEGVLALCEALRFNTTLEELDISNNRINWQGAEILGRALQRNATLKTLKVGNNPLTTTGAMDLVEGAEVKTSGLHVLDLSAVPVLSETALLAVVINRRRPFQFLHGDVVHTPDVLGQRFILQATAMQRLIAYMKLLGIRPVELLRGFDKSVQFNISKSDFKQRLRKCNVQLFNFEMDALADTIAVHGEIDYKKLVEAVREEIYGERRMKIKEREKQKKIKEKHKRILDLNLQKEVVSTDDEELIVTTSQRGGSQIKKLPSLVSLRPNSGTSISSKLSVPKETPKSSGISYSAPLGGEKKEQKRKKNDV